jgi:CheY-like chemotaxis protein
MNDTGSGTVLVVDDDQDIRETIALILESAGYNVDAAPNGAEALSVLRGGSSRPCIVLLDLMMPVMDGGQFRREQQRDPSLADIPVVVLSGDGRVETKAAELGVDAYLRKPIGIDDLLDVVARCRR